MSNNSKFVITIGRERGSGGRMIGKELARRFHIHAGSLAQLKQKPQYLRLCGVQAVSKVVLLKGATSPAEAKGIYRCMEDGSLETIWEQPNC